ncbi:hypothetical protein GN956_G9604 [Arapaima gigas]
MQLPGENSLEHVHLSGNACRHGDRTSAGTLTDWREARLPPEEHGFEARRAAFPASHHQSLRSFKATPKFYAALRGQDIGVGPQRNVRLFPATSAAVCASARGAASQWHLTCIDPLRNVMSGTEEHPKRTEGTTGDKSWRNNQTTGCNYRLQREVSRKVNQTTGKWFEPEVTFVKVLENVSENLAGPLRSAFAQAVVLAVTPARGLLGVPQEEDPAKTVPAADRRWVEEQQQPDPPPPSLLRPPSAPAPLQMSPGPLRSPPRCRGSPASTTCRQMECLYPEKPSSLWWSGGTSLLPATFPLDPLTRLTRPAFFSHSSAGLACLLRR